MSATRGTDAPQVIDVDVTTHGEFPGAADYAREKIGELGRLSPRPVLYAHVKLTRHHDPAVEFPVVAQANLDVNGRPVRAQVHAATAREAVDRLESALRRRLEHVAERWETKKGAGPGHRPWQEQPAGHRPSHPTSSADDPSVVRRKSFTMAPCTLDEAVDELELLDYDFHLFTEKETGTAAVIYRDGQAGRRVALVAPELAGQVGPSEQEVTISEIAPPCLREEEAVERLGLLGLPFLFFIDAAEGRACVLYRRYDGQYGLVTPAG
ncbi:HPF/RaiA family ribosome-associated protein [Mycobacterium sp. Y57]|uniref:ribosome hibernation promotion factor n=1 Tax=Mycolicibacterium xanthum TaxID=2796469 RepID=UPI001C851030|nr:HPF/RaiA family ribosome-associated protein [Mycolicibacterium xanthum]MBX7433675.1 HPF/RaiA family ribosome-associated protein [Mycolicibacterium xanthum]